MSVLFKRLFLAALLATTPALAMAQSDDAPDEAVAETSVEAEEAVDADEEEASDEDAETASDEMSEEDAQAVAWAEQLRQRQHEGDVALGVCGGRMTALMWFYQSSVADGREDLQPAYDALKASRTVLKEEAERRAVEDGIGTSVSVMNEQSSDLWDALIDASEKPEDFQKAHDELFASVQECLSLFFRRGETTAKAGAEPAESEEETDAADDETEEAAD